MRTATAISVSGSLVLAAAVAAIPLHSSPTHLRQVATRAPAAISKPWEVRAVRPVEHRANRSEIRTPMHVQQSAKPVVASSWSVIGDVTMYCLSGTMADGEPVHSGAVATLDRSLPFGTHITIPGLGTYVVEDHIGYGSDFDVWTSSCATATQWGRHRLQVSITR